MDEMRGDGTTLIYVSHNMESVRQICRNALWLDKGVARMSGTVEEVAEAYEKHLGFEIR